MHSRIAKRDRRGQTAGKVDRSRSIRHVSIAESCPCPRHCGGGTTRFHGASGARGSRRGSARPLARGLHHHPAGRPAVDRGRRPDVRGRRRGRQLPGDGLAYARGDGRLLDPADQGAGRDLVQRRRPVADGAPVQHRLGVRADGPRYAQRRHGHPYRRHARWHPGRADRADPAHRARPQGQPHRGRALGADEVLPVERHHAQPADLQPARHRRVRRPEPGLPGDRHPAGPGRRAARLGGGGRLHPATGRPPARSELPRSAGPGGDLPGDRSGPRSLRRHGDREGHRGPTALRGTRPRRRYHRVVRGRRLGPGAGGGPVGPRHGPGRSGRAAGRQGGVPAAVERPDRREPAR